MRRTLAAVLVLAGLALLAWVVVEPRLQEQRAAQAQARLSSQVPDGAPGASGPEPRAGRSAQPTAVPVEPGEALVTMSIPRLGADWHWTAVEGTTPGLLEAGPGHYAGTAWPGEVGNAAFAAHRAGHGDPFLDFDLLRVGDDVVLAQGGVRWLYEITHEPRVVPETAGWVLDPLPGRQLTLTTCWPRYGSEKRMFVRAELATVQQRVGESWLEVPGAPA